MENQQIEVVKTQVAKAIETVRALPVTSLEEYTEAVEIGGKLKKVSKMVTERKEEITKPLNEALKSARALFKPMEDTLDEAESELKNKMLSFKDLERKQEEEARKKADEEIKKNEELLAKKEITPEQSRTKFFVSRLASRKD
jgi:coenzyme F420-reducing hydrogenase alpha subunit